MAQHPNIAIAADIRDHCLAKRARLLGRRVTRIYDDALRPVGLTSGQLTILVAVTLNPGALSSQLQERLDIEQSSFSRNAAVMQRQGWIEKHSVEGQRGQGLCRVARLRDLMTDAGQDALERAPIQLLVVNDEDVRFPQN